MEHEYELNLIPFYALTLSLNKFIYNDIDFVYKKKKEDFYMCGKSSEFYDCIMAKEYSLIVEEYFKKCVGILEYTDKHKDEKIESDINNLFKRGYRKVYLYFKNFSSEDEIDMEDFYKSFFTKRFDSMKDDEINSSAIAAVFFALQYKNVTNMELIEGILYAQWRYYQGERRLTLESADSKYKNEVEYYLKKCPKKIFEDTFIKNKAKYHGYEFLFDIEHLSSSIFNDLTFKEDDIKEIILSYICSKNYYEFDEPFEDYVHHSVFLLAMCKAYKKVKEMYFANNKETMYIELGAIKKEIGKYITLLQLEKEKNNTLIQQQREAEHFLEQENEILKKENQRLRMEMEKMQNDSKEVAALREYIFGENNDISLYDDEDIDMVRLNKLKGVIIGGHPNWRNKIKEKLPDWNFIDVDVSSIDNGYFNEKNIVIFSTSYLKHALYRKIMNFVRDKDCILGYISSTNLEISIKEIYEICKNV